MPRPTPIEVESAHESLDSSSAVRCETLGFYRRWRHSGRRHDDLVAVRRPVERMARLAVFRRRGAGYLGRFHAQKYAVLANSELVGIADPSPPVREAVAKELGVAAYADYRELLGRVDAVSIVTPTPYHFNVA